MTTNQNQFTDSKHASSKQGFTLIELIVTVSLVVVTIMSFIATMSYVGQKKREMTEQQRLQFLVNEQLDRIRLQGYWTHDVDINRPLFPTSDYDYAVEWSKRLTDFDIQSGEITSQFFKRVDGEWSPFETQPFDGNHDRGRMMVTVSLSSQLQEVTVTGSTLLAVHSTFQSADAVLRYLKRALLVYKDIQGEYPASYQLSSLVTAGVIDEIPNDPLTDLLPKQTHVEEAIDWAYVHHEAQKMIQLYAFTRPDTQELWFYE